MNTILNPINPSIYQSQNTEPQYVTAKNPNKAILYLESQDCPLQTNKVDIVFSTIKKQGDYPSPMAYGISRLTIDTVHINWVTPNINPRNNTIKFYSSVSNTFHTVNVIEGFYTDSVNIMNAVVAAMNTETGASGLTFSYTSSLTNDDVYRLLSAGGDYYISTDCTAVTRGYQLYNLPITQNPENSKFVGVVSGFYTTYLDICSNTLTQFSKLDTYTSNLNVNVVYRIYFYADDKDGPHVLSYENVNSRNISYNYLSNSPLTTIDFQLRDQFGDPLYLPRGATGTPGGFWWGISLSIEL